MKKWYLLAVLFVIAAGSFLTGAWVNHISHRGKPGERKILYYVDPMNPAYKSDKPGVAPGCGMPLEAVYADENGSEGKEANLLKSMPQGTIKIPAERQQLIGIKTMTVEKVPWTYIVRVLGRVTPDENRTYRINAAINGWIEDVQPVTTGSLVKKNEVLATYYSLEYRTAVQVYYNLIITSKSGAVKKESQGTKIEQNISGLTPTQLKAGRDVVRDSVRRDILRDITRDLNFTSDKAQRYYYRKSLLNYGISETQIDDMDKGGTIAEDIEIRSPVQGFILSRNVNPGLRFDRGAEFFRIADLSRVWILTDIFENETSLFQPGKRVKMELPYLNKTLYARVSKVLPEFDSKTRTFKMRLEADNPGFIMRPDMFVNVEIPISVQSAIVVPMDAVLDSGLKKTVFVDRGNGFFEPRQVETGRFLGEGVEVVRGLMPGEKIVISGNFLIDSETRLQMASSGVAGKIVRDPVCGMDIDEDQSRAKGNFLEYRGKTYFFCDSGDREAFRKDPERYLKPASGTRTMDMPPLSEKKMNQKPTETMTMSKGQEDSKKVPQVMGPAPMVDEKTGTGKMSSSQSDSSPESKNVMISPITAGPSPQPKKVGPSPASSLPESEDGRQQPSMSVVPPESKTGNGKVPSKVITPQTTKKDLFPTSPPAQSKKGDLFPAGPPAQSKTKDLFPASPPAQSKKGDLFTTNPPSQPKKSEKRSIAIPPNLRQGGNISPRIRIPERESEPIKTPGNEGDHDQ